ncbi:ATP-binding protein [Sphaerotilaceae bacterium SBD11-9]
MPAAPEGLTPIHLTVLAQDGRLAASLTDLQLVARMETIEVAPDELAALKRRAEAWPGDRVACTDPSGRHALGDAVCGFGSQLLRTLLPAAVAGFLRDTPPRALRLQLDPSLAWVPWELGFDGESFLGEKLRLCRRIVAELPPAQVARPPVLHGALKVLVLTGGARPASAMQGLVARLRGIGALAVSAAHVQDLRRDELLALVASTDVLHYVGPTDGCVGPDGSALWWQDGEPLAVGALAALAAVPRLLISQNTAAPMAGAGERTNRAVAMSACRFGLNMLTCESTGDGQNGLEFMLAVYAALLRGAPADEAVRSARAALHSSTGIAALAALRPELYGDGAVVVNPPRAPAEDDLRQVTIMSIDLVESTRLLAVLGAERYSDVLAQYHERCAEILQSCGGVPDDFQGDDGAMCYFGVPVAREDAAVQALRAGLELVDAVQRLGLSVRIGVCTGQVVMREGQPIGSAVHLAARLQSIAAPGTIVVGESTRRIVKERFRFQPLEQVARLKGFDEPQPCHRLLGPAQTATRENAAGAGGVPQMTPFVGRRDELQALQVHWAAVQGGSLRLVRIQGEAGIGKSRLVREFKRSLVDQGHEVFECRCAPEHVNSAFQPLIEALRGELRIGAHDSPETVLVRLRRVFSRGVEISETDIALLTDLLAIATPSRHPVLDHTAERRRQLTIDLLVLLAQRRVGSTAACMIIEDSHWIDPSTAEYLNRLANAARSLPLLILVTARSDGEAAWHPRFLVHETELSGLSPELSRALVQSTCGEHRLPGDMIHLIAARADGVPLFIEESTRMAVELGVGGGDLGAAGMPVPATILDLLAARLDRLGSAKQVAQVGGTIGREFSLPLLRAVLEHPGSPIASRDTATQLDALVRAGMLLGKDDGDDARFAFKHALMRDAAYRSLLERDRLRLHQVIASVIGERFPELAERQPELIAFHYTEAGMDAEALRCWESAARQAASRFAHAEAIGHIGHALAVLARAPQSNDRDRLELRLQLPLAARLIATQGYGAERVERAYARAMELAALLGDDAARMRVLLGLEGYHFMRADFAKARAHALDAAALAGKGRANIHHVQTQWALANILMHQGEMEAAVQQMDACRDEYDQLEHHPAAVQDPGVMCLCYSAWSLWQLGFPDQALQRVLDVVVHAERLKHKFSIGEAYGFRAAVQHFRGENRAALDSADRAIELCEEEGFAVWLAHARIMRGRIVADLGDSTAGIEEMRQGYGLWAATGAVVTTPFYLTLRAEGLALAQRPEEGLVLLEQALGIVNRTGERYYEAEIRRLTGALTLQSAARAGLDRAAEAEAWMLQALECAHARKLASLSLRAATSLSDLWLQQGQRAHAIDLLGSARRAVQGGEGTRDLLNAQVRLAALRGTAH